VISTGRPGYQPSLAGIRAGCAQYARDALVEPGDTPGPAPQRAQHLELAVRAQHRARPVVEGVLVGGDAGCCSRRVFEVVAIAIAQRRRGQPTEGAPPAATAFALPPAAIDDQG
jgi:hypothetical protein